MNQSNTANNGPVYAVQGRGRIKISNNAGPGKQGLGIDTKVLLVGLLTDVVFFFYGMLEYTGKGTTADNWRAFIFLVLFLVTVGMIGRWIRRRI